MKQLTKTRLFDYVQADSQAEYVQNTQELIADFADNVSAVSDSKNATVVFRTLNYARIQLLTLKEKYLNEPDKVGEKYGAEAIAC